MQVRTGNGELHIIEINSGGVHFDETHNKPPGAMLRQSGGASNRSWGELKAMVNEEKKKGYSLLSNNCFQLTDRIKAFLV